MNADNQIELNTGAETTWCPGCHNFMLLRAVQDALKDLINEKDNIEQESIVMSTGIGCHGKMFDYLNVGGVYSLHGRVLPTCVGMKLGNPQLTVLGFGGDGDTYAEGISHFIHTARYNLDMTMFVHNNQVFALTTGQGTPASEQGFKTKSQPEGVANKPLNPLKLSLDAGATFVARIYPQKMNHAKQVIKQAILHPGFSHLDVAIPCLIYHQDAEFLQNNIYELEDHNEKDRQAALDKIEEWDYDPNKDDQQVPVGVFYQNKQVTLADKLPTEKKLKARGEGWYQVER